MAWARGPSIEDVPEYIDSKGQPFLFFRTKGKIVVRKCDPKGIASAEDACKALPGSADFVVAEREFADILKSLLLLGEGNYTPDMKANLELYRKIQSEGVQKAMMTIAQAKENKSIISSPNHILSLLDEALEGERLCSAEDKLPSTGIHASLDMQKVKKAIGQVEKNIRYLVEGISSSGRLMYVSSKEDNRNFDYNLLNSYLDFFAVAK